MALLELATTRTNNFIGIDKLFVLNSYFRIKKADGASLNSFQSNSKPCLGSACLSYKNKRVKKTVQIVACIVSSYCIIYCVTTFQFTISVKVLLLRFLAFFLEISAYLKGIAWKVVTAVGTIQWENLNLLCKLKLQP